MSKSRFPEILGAVLVFALTAGTDVHGASEGRQPWAAHSGLDFVQAVINADNYRAEAGGLAMKKSVSADVREFGRMLWEDSIEDARRLRWLLNEHQPGVVLPSKVSPEYMFVIDQLVMVSGDEFDRRFIAQQSASLRDALTLAQEYARAGDDFDLKDFAERSVPRIEMQLQRIVAIGDAHARVAAR